MQKYLWGGAALIVAGAASVYVASDYFLRHPESVILRAGNALGTAAAYSNPLSVMNRSTSGTDTVRQDGTEVAQVTLVKPVIGDDGEETIEPIQVDAIPSGPIVPPEAEAAEESEWQPNPETIDEAPKPMPYAEVEPTEMQAMIEAIVNGAAGSEKEAEDMAVANILQQFNELMRAGKRKAARLLAADLRKAYPDNTIVQMAYAMSTTRMGCGPADEGRESGTEACEITIPTGWLDLAMRMVQSVMTGVPEQIDEMPQEGMSDDEMGDEKSPTETEEPSYYHHHYEGCPYMGGGCPYPHSTPMQSPVEIPATKPSKFKKPKTSDMTLNRTSERRSFSPPILDTMEFRPSDAGNYPIAKTGPF